MVPLYVKGAVEGGDTMNNVVCFNEYKVMLLSCTSCNYLECICADLELEELTAHDWLNDMDCDGVCNICWFVHSCIGMEDAIPIHLLREEVI